MCIVRFELSSYVSTFVALTLFTIAYFTDDSPSHGVVITPPQAKVHLKFFLHQNFSLGGLRVSIADFGFEGPGFNASSSSIFIKKKKRYSRDLNTGPQVPKSAMVAPRPPIDENC